MSPLKKKSELNEKFYWRSFDQLENRPDYLKFLEEEFPQEASVETGKISRRSFLSLVGATLAFAGVAGCRRPVENIVPYVSYPENLVLGEPEQYATTMPLGLSAYGMLVTCHEGRPTKIEGNENHPSSRGKSSTFMQAALLNLYDPDRAQKIKQGEFDSNWDEFNLNLTELRVKHENNKGKGLAVISGESTSPTLIRLKEEFQKKFPQAKWIAFNNVSDENILSGIQEVTHQDLRPVYNYDNTEIILSLDSDFLYLESESLNASQGFSAKRGIDEVYPWMNRLYMAESSYSLTGSMADHRLSIPPSQIYNLLMAIAQEIKYLDVPIPELKYFPTDNTDSFDRNWIEAVADDLVKNQGKSIIIAGRNQDYRVHMLALVINRALGNLGNTLELHECKNQITSKLAELDNLVKEINQDKINTLFVINANPAYDAPIDLNFAKTLNRIENSIYLGIYENETAKLCKWRINGTHFLESWGDCQAADSTLSVIQPMIAPLFFGISEIELINTFINGELVPGYEIVRQTWSNILRNTDFESNWRKILHDGIYSEKRKPAKNIKFDIKNRIEWKRMHQEPGVYELVYAADYSVYDGSFSNNGWMQELPDPLTKIIWDNAALISKKTADQLHVTSGDIVSIYLNDKSIQIPVWVLPGQSDNVVTLPLGYGRSFGRVSREVGVNVNSVRFSHNFYYASGANIQSTGKTHILASTQNHGSMEGRPLIRESTLKKYKNDPEFARHEVHVPDLKSLWKDHEYNQGYQWGMSIDLNACIGCGVCTIACQSENNIPVVGKKQGDYGREMHWMRVDRYFGGDEHHPEVRFQPMSCQHCEMAPCEQVCPVAATVHDSEGLNVMTYNRCIGTRYCSNNCPYKARRFNFFNYTNQFPELVKMAQNPDVTVRSRGVMEKCTYCLQRINRVKRKAKLENRNLHDGEMRTACQQACPTDAIKFGNILDKKSKIVEAKESDRSYEVLAEFNLRPRTSYQARISNPNPLLEKKKI